MAPVIRNARGSATPDILIAAMILAAAWAAIVVFGSMGVPDRGPAHWEARP